MTSTTVLHNQYDRDLRAPLFSQLGKRIGQRWRRLITLLLFDIGALMISWQVTASFDNPFYLLNGNQNGLLAIATIIAFQISLLASKELYQAGDKRRDYINIAKTLTLAHLLLLFTIFFFQSSTPISRQSFILSGVLSVALVCSFRYSIDITIENLRQQGFLRYPIYLISKLEDKTSAIKLLESERRYYFAGWADINNINEQEIVLKDLYRLKVSDVFIYSWKSINSQPLFYLKLKNAGINVYILPTRLQVVEQNIKLRFLGKIPTFELSSYLTTGSDFLIKRCFDFIFATALILILIPVYLLISLLIAIDSSGSIFYKQNRMGLHGKTFQIWKFRTMKTDAERSQKSIEFSHQWKDGALFQIENDPRITRIGKFLRRYSLDELPQLFNVVRGEMSLVGPRPVPNSDVEKFADRHFIRYQVLPGMTGLWQVSRSNSDDYEIDKVVSLDIKYMENWSLWLDIQILLKTIAVVLSHKGAY
ncbi:sugar transferase [Scytonema millei]|uniref:Sugar transferase n=1 Tax=Scytonema millei VB511283 TaxID=1245923 RepID=A0A9X5EAR5_9CYAN|nr:sugar transferase [Scytonema millei]NHC38076.1 sugar transferase [Scytonema millei VB511283]